MVIVETAIAIPVLVIAAVTLVWAVGVATSAVALGDACGRIAREVSRGADAAAMVADMHIDRPTATFDFVDLDSGDVRVVGRERVAAPGLLSGFAFTITRTVVAAREWTSA
ncbi:MAG: hypothetical protein ORN20_09250 [Candidatus Nanopelagicales bacterium]|jgi:hypothetical protein|nr:hypothetical protein [Candidatus Nanopelagicales bacterium]